MSELNENLNQLAERGQRRGADDVLAAAIATANEDTEIVAVSLDEGDPPQATKRRNGRSVFAAGGIAALLGVVTLAISALVGGSGADSPEAAVRQLANAVANEDAIAAVDVLAPAEARSLKETLDHASTKAEELAIIDSASTPLAGVDFSVDGLELDTVKLAPGVSKVVATGGEFKVSTDSAEFSGLIQRAVGDTPNSEARTKLASLRPMETDPFVVVIQRDGNWYVSPTYTVFEYLRIANQGAPADFGSGIASAASLGADSPEAAAEDLLNATAAGDWERVLALMPPDEIPAYDYRDWLVTEFGDEAPEWNVTSFEATTEVDGDNATVTVAATVDTPDGTITFADDCTGYPWLFVTQSSESDACISGSAFLSQFLGLASADRGHDVEVRAVQRDGRWFISPVATALDYVEEGIGQVNRQYLYVMLGVGDVLEAEAAIRLDTPITATGGVHVYSFEGHAGQRIIGQSTGSEVGSTVSATLYGPDGERVDGDYSLFEYEPVTLPADGTYKVALFEYTKDPYTIWDVDSAPNEALQAPYNDEYESAPAIDPSAPIDETLTLGTPSQPIELDASGSDFQRVYSFGGHAGQEIEGYIDGAVGMKVVIVAPDGNYLGGSSSVLYSSTVLLPADGTYKLLLDASGFGSYQLTLWDAAVGPPADLDFGSNPGDNCRVEIVNDTETETCTGSAQAPATTAPLTPTTTP